MSVIDDDAWDSIVENCRAAADSVDSIAADLQGARIHLATLLRQAHIAYGVTWGELARALGRSRADVQRLAGVSDRE